MATAEVVIDDEVSTENIRVCVCASHTILLTFPEIPEF